MYGILEGNESNSYFLIDTDGDGFLDYKTQDNYIPNWIIFNIPLKRSYPEDFLNICNNLYSEYNKELGPSKETIGNKMHEISAKITDQNSENRDLYYSLLFYTYTVNNPSCSKSIMLSLIKDIGSLYDRQTSPLFFLYLGESYINNGSIDQALDSFSILKQIDRKSKIADYYIAMLTDKKSNTQSNIAEFRKNNPNFWTLK